MTEHWFSVSPPPSSLRGTPWGFYQRRKGGLMNIHVNNTAGDATQFAENSSEKFPLCEKKTQVHLCCTVCTQAWPCCALSLSHYFSAFLWHPTRPRTNVWNSHTHKHAQARTYMYLKPHTCFRVYVVWLVIFTFPSRGSFVQRTATFCCAVMQHPSLGDVRTFSTVSESGWFTQT